MQTFRLTDLSKLHFSKKKTWDDLKTRVLKILKENQELSHLVKTQRNLNSSSQTIITKDDIRIWSTPLSQTQLITTASDNLIKGFCLDQFINHPIEQILSGQKKDSEDEDRDILLVELNEPQEKTFLLKSVFGDETPEILA